MSSDEDSQRGLVRKVIELSLSVRETERAIKRINRGDSETVEKKEVKRNNDANMKAAETKMRRHLGTQVRIISDGKGTGGKIEIEYYSESDLDRIYRLILNNK